MSAPTLMPLPLVPQALERVKGVFTDVPGTQLSTLEVARLAGLEEEHCGTILEALVGVGFLTHSRHGRFRQPE